MALMSQAQVPEGMVNRVPWGTPLSRWTPAMLERGLDEVAPRENPKDDTSPRHVDPYFPRTAANIAAELATR
jgi:hypothetical protein